jgi:hypothetical protein
MAVTQPGLGWLVMLGASPFTLAAAAAGAFGFFARAPQLGSLSTATYVRPFLSEGHGGSIPEGEPSSVHTSIVVRLPTGCPPRSRWLQTRRRLWVCVRASR